MLPAGDAEHDVRAAQRRERLGAAPVRLRDDADAKPLRLQQAADQRRAEAGVVDVGVAGDQDDVAAVPARARPSRRATSAARARCRTARPSTCAAKTGSPAPGRARRSANPPNARPTAAAAAAAGRAEPVESAAAMAGLPITRDHASAALLAKVASPRPGPRRTRPITRSPAATARRQRSRHGTPPPPPAGRRDAPAAPGRAQVAGDHSFPNRPGTELPLAPPRQVHHRPQHRHPEYGFAVQARIALALARGISASSRSRAPSARVPRLRRCPVFVTLRQHRADRIGRPRRQSTQRYPLAPISFIVRQSRMSAHRAPPERSPSGPALARRSPPSGSDRGNEALPVATITSVNCRPDRKAARLVPKFNARRVSRYTAGPLAADSFRRLTPAFSRAARTNAMPLSDSRIAAVAVASRICGRWRP